MTIKQVLEDFNLTQQEIADFMGISRDRVGKWIQEKRDVPPKSHDAKSFDIAVKFITELGKTKAKAAIKNFRIIAGNVEPLAAYNNTINSGMVSEPSGKYSKSTKSNNLVPYYDVDIIAGTRELYDDNPNTTPAYYMDVPEFSGCKAFRVYADSMQPLIDAGSIMFCRPIANWHDFIEFGQIYAIEVDDNRRFIKQIRRSKQKGYFIMHSQNPEYDDFEVPVKNIRNIWLIEGWMRKKTQ